MINPFTKKKKTRKTPSPIKSVVIPNNNNTISGTIVGLHSSLSPIVNGTLSVGSGSGGYWGSTGINGPIQTASSASFSYSSAATYTFWTPEEMMEQRKKQLSDEFEQNPELFSEIIVELRKRKIKKIKENL